MATLEPSQIECYLKQLVDFLTFTNEASLLLTYPVAGGLRAVPAGTTVVSLTRGAVQRPDLSELMIGKLDSKLLFAKSAALFADSDIDVELLGGGGSSGKLHIAQCTPTNLRGAVFDEMRLSADYPYDLKLVCSTIPVNPIEEHPQVSSQKRYGAATSANIFTAVPFGPTGGGALAAAYLKAVIFTGNIGTKVFAIRNSGSNSVDLNIRFLLVEGQTWMDDPVTSASLTLAAGDTAALETSVPCQFIQLRIKSTTANSHSTITAQYFGHTVLR